MSDARTAWAEPDPQDLGGGVFRVPLPLPNDGLRAVNVYAIESDTGLVMIDGGWALAESEDRLAASLKQLGFSMADITTFLVTHLHRDHYTQAIAVRRKFGARVSVGAGEEPNLRATAEWTRGERSAIDVDHLLRAGAGSLVERLQLLRSDEQPGSAEDWEAPDEWLADDARITAGSRTLRVIATPGHTRGHVVFHDAQAKLLFAGDHVLPQITPSIGFEPAKAPLPLRDYLQSLRLMQELPDARLLPAHGAATGSVHERVGELLAHHEDRLSATAQVALAGAATALEAATALPWTRRGFPFENLDLFNQLLAVSETAAHLDVLVLQGRLASSRTVEGVQLYQAVR